jgi:long-chain acyl-CoA synthetase
MSNIARQLHYRIGTQPTATAVHAQGRTLSFGELGARLAGTAGSLRRLWGLQPGERVALWLENRFEFFELVFACWHAGLVAVPVNAKLHPRELAFIAADCGARLVITSPALEAGLAEALEQAGASSEVLVAGSGRWAQLPEGTPPPCAEVHPDDPAWIFYTSGTTGRPKGATITHRNLVFMTLAYLADIEQVAPGDTMLHAAPLSHGSGLYGLPHLIGGGQQVVLPGFDPTSVLEGLARWPRVSMFAAPTMVSRLLLQAGPQPHVPGLRHIIYGGGPMYLSDQRRAVEAFGLRLYQLFGQGESPMTITGLNAAQHDGDGGPAHLRRLGSCGLARTGVEVRVVDGQGSDLPAGEIGEVITRSDCVMRGYWNNPAATAAALREGWLWTGDVGSLDEQGFLTLRDRSKDLIIRAGSNIYPREVEEVLLRHPSVLECSVIGHPDPDLGETVAAYVVARPGQQPRTEELDALCLDHIARFKRPRLYRFTDALPKNNYGKVLKTELRAQLAREQADGARAGSHTQAQEAGDPAR